MKGLRVTKNIKEIMFEGVSGELESKKKKITQKIFEVNSSFHVKQHPMRKVWFLFLKSFVLVLAKLSFSPGDWPLGYHSMKFRHFPDFSYIPKILSLKSFCNFLRQLVYTMFISNNRPSFQLWWKENLVKHRKV